MGLTHDMGVATGLKPPASEIAKAQDFLSSRELLPQGKTPESASLFSYSKSTEMPVVVQTVETLKRLGIEHEILNRNPRGDKIIIAFEGQGDKDLKAAVQASKQRQSLDKMVAAAVHMDM